MSEIENPPAFPQTGNGTWSLHPAEGMTLRDWFAGQAMAEGANWVAANESGSYTEAALVAYEYADAMLAARQQPAPDTEAMEHVACFDEGEFRWLSGRKPRDCELYATRKTGGAS